MKPITERLTKAIEEGINYTAIGKPMGWEIYIQRIARKVEHEVRNIVQEEVNAVHLEYSNDLQHTNSFHG